MEAIDHLDLVVSDLQARLDGDRARARDRDLVKRVAELEARLAELVGGGGDGGRS